MDDRRIKKPKLTWKAIPVALLFGILLPIGVIVLGRYTDRILNLSPFPSSPFNQILGIVILLLGYIFGLGSIYQLYQAGLGLPWGDMDETAQSTKLVTTGLYRYTRNPMIFGTLCLIAGYGCIAQSITGMILFPTLFIIILYIWVKYREDPALEERFGKDYVDYKKNTPFLFPQLWRIISRKE